MAAQSPVKKNIENKPNALPTLSPEEWMKKQRPPRVLLFGRRGAGKSSLFNCLIRQMNRFKTDCEYVTPDGKWHSIYLKDYFQLPQQGVQEGQREQENQLWIEVKELQGAGNKKGVTVEDLETFKEKFKADNPPPIADIILYVVPAGDVDSYIENELKMLKAMYGLWEEGKEPALITVLNRCDLLKPETLHLHKYEKQKETGTWQLKPEAQKGALNCTMEKLDKKLENIKRTKKSISEQIETTLGHKSKATVPVVSLWDDDDGDRRWNIEELMITLIKNVPHEVMLATVVPMDRAIIWAKLAKQFDKVSGHSWAQKLWSGVTRVWRSESEEPLMLALKELFERLFKFLELESYTHFKTELEDLFLMSVYQCMSAGDFTEKRLFQTFIQCCEDRFGPSHNISIKVKNGLAAVIV